MKEAGEIVDEMAHTLRTGVVRGFAVFLVKVMKQLFQRVYVNEEGVQKVSSVLQIKYCSFHISLSKAFWR